MKARAEFSTQRTLSLFEDFGQAKTTNIYSHRKKIIW